MTTEERLARLTERHEALTQSVELLNADLRETQQKLAQVEDEDAPKVFNVVWLDNL